MKKIFAILVVILTIAEYLPAQNIFNINDPIVRYNAAQPLGSAQNPNPATPGLQKWVSTPTNGVSVGSSSVDVSSFKQYFINFSGTPMAFRIKFPKSFTHPDSASKQYPVMLFLHGAGEVGCPDNNGVYNNEKQLWLGGALFRDLVDQNKFDGFLLYPQLVNAEGCWGAWGGTTSANFNAVINMIDSMSKYIRADVDRVMVNGLSGGGYGAWRMADAYPQRIAKILPSAAAGSTTNRNNFVHIPIWFATGGKDPDPSPAQAAQSYNRMKEIGANIRHTLYEDLGHSVWYRHWREPDYAAQMNDMHKANPLVFFQHNDFCVNETISARLGITQGFYAYEWQRDNITIATRTGTTNSIVQPAHVTSYSGNEIIVKSLGTYRVRFKRSASAQWSAWSPKPVVVGIKEVTQTAPVTVAGAYSKVLPALDGNTTVPLQMPEGFQNYEWYRVSDNSLVAGTRIYNAPVGIYKAKYSEEFGCGTTFSPDFQVVDATSSPKPEAPTKLISTPVSQTSIRIDWTQGAGETGFEIYRAANAGGPYSFVAVTSADIVTFTDTGLISAIPYYYVVRAVSNTGASVQTNEATAKTLADFSFPTAPGNLQYRGSTASTVNLRWSAANDNGGIKRYDIYANDVKMFSTKNTSFTVYNLDSLTTYTFTVRAVDQSENMSPPSNQVTGFTHRQGINYKYYTTTANWSVLPNYASLTPVKTGTIDSMNINQTSINSLITKYGFLWEGWIYVPVTAEYTFETRSDDGSRVYIDAPYNYSATPLVNNDGIHGMVSKFGTVTLTHGYHTISVAFFQRINGYGFELYWKNNLGLAREKIPMHFFTFQQAAIAEPPAIPAGLSAVMVSYNQIRLNWTDNNANEKGYELVRSLTSTGVYAPVGTAAANQSTFVDSGLAAAKTYYYKMRTITSGSESPYTGTVSTTTDIAPKLTPAPNPLTVFGGPNNSISLNWKDNSTNEWNYRVYRSLNGTTFKVIAALKPNTNAYTDQAVVSQTTYYYYVQGYNAAGLGPWSNVVKIKAGNSAPVISSLETFFAKTNQTQTENFTVTDETGDIVSVRIIDKPAFLNVAGTGGSGFSITAAPGQDNVGEYSITVEASDNNGGVSTVKLTVVVTDHQTRSVFINFGQEGKTAQAPWNNWLGIRAAGNMITGLKDENNVTTNITLATVNAWNTSTILGHITGNNSGVVPDAALESGIADNGAAKQIRIGGLNAAKKYNLEFIGSQNEGLAATSQYSASGQNPVMDARYNTTRAANLNGLTPDINGEILVTVTRTGGALVTYLNALIIEEMDPTLTLLNPEHLYAEPLDRNRIALSWTDRASNEASTGGYEIQRAGDSLFSQNLTVLSLPANTTQYTDATVTPDTRYWYRVRAKNGTDYSLFSNKYTAVTPASIVYINFNSTLPDAAFPWNNTKASPLNEFIIDELYTQSGSLSGLSFAVTKVFNGEFTAGVNTGNNSGVVPDNVLASNFWLDNTQHCQVKISGLNHTCRYRIGFTGSSGNVGWFKGNYTATYSIAGKTVYLNSWMNSTKIVYLSDLRPDVNGELLIDFSTTAIAQWAFNAGMIVQEYNDARGGSELYMSNSLLDTSGLYETAVANHYRVSTYPNPFRDQVYLDFYNTATGNRIIAEIYDINGRLLQRRNYNELPAGRNTLRIEPATSTSGNGIYLLALKVNGKIVHATKIVKSKE